jgi:hypothetical protein
MMSSCPGERTLRRLGAGALGDSTYAAIEEHLESCAECPDLLDRLSHRCTDPTFVLPGPRQSPRLPDFEIRAEIGRGAMGVVYLALRGSLGRPVALKVLPGAIGADALPVARRRWMREARAVSSIRHPNVVPLYDCGEADGWFFLVFEYVPGGNLKQRLTGPLPPRAAATLVETIARAVGYIHGRGLLHLDLKPSNILLDGEADAPWDRIVPRVSDFGLALFDEPDAAETSLAGPHGTPSYMAPEQVAATRARIGPAADIHAMGAILYELMTGRPPFQGTTAIETLDQVRGQEPVPPRRLNPTIPRDLETICLTCLRKNPDRRYGSAEALAEDLRRWLNGRPISARPVAHAERGWRLCRRRPLVSALAAILAMTLAAGFLIVLLLWRDAERARHRAQADYELGRAALAEILDLGERSIEPTVVVSRDRFVTSLDSTRTRILELARRRPDDLAVWNLLAVVDLFLGRNLEFQGRLVEGEALYSESLRYWDRIIAGDPTPIAPKYRRWQTLECLGRILEQQGKPDEGLPFWENAVATGEVLLPLQSRPDVNTMDVCRMALARSLERRGDHLRARGLLVANVAMLREVPPDARIPFQVEELRRTWEELMRLRWESETEAGEFRVSRASIPQPTNPEADPRDATIECEAGYRLQCRYAEIATAQRHTGHLDESRKTVDRLLIFGRSLVARHPGQPASHLALCEAHTQSYKNAWRLEDRASIEAGLRQALHEARLALSLDLRDARARDRSNIFERRLRDLLAPKLALERLDPGTSERPGR